MIDISSFQLITKCRRRGEISIAIELFLKRNPNNAYTNSEIAQNLPQYRETLVFSALHHLVELGILEHRSPYYKLKELTTINENHTHHTNCPLNSEDKS